MGKAKMSRPLGVLDSDQIAVRVKFEPFINRYLERLISASWDEQNNSKKAINLGDDELALALMLNYFIVISGGSAAVKELEIAFVSRPRSSEIIPGVGDLFSGITLLEMVSRANRTFKNAKRLPKLHGQTSGYEPGQGPLASFSDDEIAELSFVAHASISGRMASGLQIGDFFKNLVSEYSERSETTS